MKKNLTDKRILITGGAGFIGSNLCEFFLNNGSKVICLDNFSTGNKKNIENLIENKNFDLIEGSIEDYDLCNGVTKKVDYVLHQAALGSVPRSIDDPLSTNNSNIGGFLNMLVACKENKIKRFVFAASSSTYGDSNVLPKVEDSIGKPLSPYAITKYVNELYASNFKYIYGLDFIGLRYFNVFGRNQDPNGSYAAVIPKFTSLLINHESPIINGDGTFSRDFTYIDNIIDINYLALTTENPNSLDQIYNAAYGERNSINDLVKCLIKHLKVYDKKIANVPIKYGKNRKGDIPHSLASIKKAKELLKYNPIYDLNSGIENYIKWFWNNQ